MAPLHDLLGAALDVTRTREADWLLQASQLSQEIADAVLGNPDNLREVQQAVAKAAETAGCDLIVGASPAADAVVRSLVDPTVAPSRAMLFELVRVTGATLASAVAELRHVDVVQAAYVDINPDARSADLLTIRPSYKPLSS